MPMRVEHQTDSFRVVYESGDAPDIGRDAGIDGVGECAVDGESQEPEAAGQHADDAPRIFIEQPGHSRPGGRVRPSLSGLGKRPTPIERSCRHRPLHDAAVEVFLDAGNDADEHLSAQ